MPFVDPILEKKRQQRFGDAVTSPSVSGAPQLQTRVTGFTDPILERKREQFYSQPQKFKGISGTQFEIKKPVKPPEVSERKGLIQKATSLVKNIDIRKLGQSIIGGAKQLPGQLKQAGGIILHGLLNQQKALDTFYQKAPTAIKPILAATPPFARSAIKAFQPEKAEQKETEARLVAEKLREKGFQASQKARKEHFEKFESSTGLQNYLEMAAFNLPQLVVSGGLTLATAIVTKNPFLATTVGLSTGYGLGASEVYEEARSHGLSDSEAMPMAQVGGAIIGGIDFLPFGRLVRKTGVAEPIKKTIIKKVASGIVSLGIQAGFEGITEGAQEIVGNAIASTYKENQDLLEGVKESVFVGALLGGFADVTTSGVIGVLNKKAQPKEVLTNIEKKVEKAIETKPTKRTPEQKQVVKAAFTSDLTPGEATGYVIDNNLGKTDEGQQIVKSVLQAQEENKNIRVSLSESDKDATVQLVEPGEEIEGIKKVAAEAEVRPVEITKELKPLAEEARKFKSAEEFVDSFGKKASEINDDLNKKLDATGKNFPTEKSIAKEFPKEVEALESAMKRENELVKIFGEATDTKLGVRPDFPSTEERKQLIDFYNQVIAAEKPLKGVIDKKRVELEKKRKVAKAKPPVKKAKPGEARKVAEKQPPSKKPVAVAGRVRRSKAVSRVIDKLQGVAESDITYNQISIAEDAAKGYDFATKNEKTAIQIARGLASPPEGMTDTAVSLAMAEVAREKGNFKLQAELELSRSIRQTRRGQEIVAERGRVDENSPSFFMSKLIDARMRQVARNRKWSYISEDVVSKSKLKRKPVAEGMDQEVQTLKKEIDTLALKKIQSAQEIINSITC